MGTPLIVGGVTIPVAIASGSRDRLDLVDRARAFDGTYRASATGNPKRSWTFAITPQSRDVADLYESILATVTAQACSGDLLGGSQNLLLRSEEMNNAAWNNTNVTVTPNLIAAPDGTVSADKLLVTGAAATTFNQGAVVAATSATYSVFIKQGSGATEANTFGIRNSTTATDLLFVTFNYATGVITYGIGSSGASVEIWADGWYRLILTVSAGITSGNTLIFYNGFAGGVETASRYFYSWGTQVNTGITPDSYIKTTSVAIDARTINCCSEILGWTPVKTSSGIRPALEFALYEV